MSVKIDFDIREQIYIKYLELEIYWIKIKFKLQSQIGKY